MEHLANGLELVLVSKCLLLTNDHVMIFWILGAIKELVEKLHFVCIYLGSLCSLTLYWDVGWAVHHDFFENWKGL